VTNDHLTTPSWALRRRARRHGIPGRPSEATPQTREREGAAPPRWPSCLLAPLRGADVLTDPELGSFAKIQGRQDVQTNSSICSLIGLATSVRWLPTSR